MKIKKLFAPILTLTILISSLSLYSFADSVTVLNGDNPTYSGKNIDLNSWISYTIPSFNGVPDRIPGDEAFYSNKGEIKLNINNQNRSYFENGGSLFVYVKKAEKKLHLNPINWSDFLSYKPENGVNSFKINGPKQDIALLFNGSISQILNNILSFIYPNSPSSFFISSVIFSILVSCFSWSTASKFALSTLLAPVVVKLTNNVGTPIFNLLSNTNPNSVSFDYGIVLTDAKDELVLNPSLPKVGEINEKAVCDLQKQMEKEIEVLQKYQGTKPSEDAIYSLLAPRNLQRRVPLTDACRHSKEDIDKMKKDIAEHKAVTYTKLKNTTPINDGFVCKLDKEHPSQTFRFVINNQSSDNPNNADLFALALQNNSINLTQDDLKVNFIAAYNAISSNSGVNSRLANVPLEVQQKINLIQNIGNPGLLSRFINWIFSFKNHFTLNNGGTTVPTPTPGTVESGGAPGAAGEAPAAGAPPADDPRVAMRKDMLNDINGQYLNEAIYNYRHSPTQGNYDRMQAALDAFNRRNHLDNATATAIHVIYQANIPQAPQAPQAPPPQWHWYNPRSWF